MKTSWERLRVSAQPCSGKEDEAIRRRRRVVLVVALAAFLVKVVMAATTYGTEDIQSWEHFARAVRAVGPVAIYGAHIPGGGYYNHPPLIGFLLVALNGLGDLGVHLNFSIRVLASACDVATSLLVFELVRVRRSVTEATWAGVLVAWSPVLFGVSGFHGNTDPIFIMFLMLALWLLADRGRPGLAGIAAAVAVSVKIVPFVALPSMLVFVVRGGRKYLTAFGAAFAVVFLVIWSWALVTDWSHVTRHVFGYSGLNRWPWGIPQFLSWAGVHSAGAVLAQRGQTLALVCAAIPAIAVYRQPDRVAEAVALAMAGFLLASPAFGVQYLVWALAVAYLVDFWCATAYNVVAGAFLIEVYSRWSHSFFWDVAPSAPLTSAERLYLVTVWFILLLVVVRAAESAFRAPSGRLLPTDVTTSVRTDQKGILSQRFGAR